MILKWRYARIACRIGADDLLRWVRIEGDERADVLLHEIRKDFPATWSQPDNEYYPTAVVAAALHAARAYNAEGVTYERDDIADAPPDGEYE